MLGKECNIVCDDVIVGTIKCTENGLEIKYTEEGKKMHKEHCKGCC